MITQSYHSQALSKMNESSKIFNSTIDLSNSQVNMTDIIHFLSDMIQINSMPPAPRAENECINYCNGRIREILTDYKSIHGYISLVICIFGTIANILNIIVLTRKDMCKAPINIILKWLAVADMFVMMEYIPFSVYMYLIFPGQKEFQHSWAVYLLFHMHFTQILHTISISLTVTLAVWRYIAINHSHGSFAVCVLSHVSEAILISFIIAPILCFPTYFVFGIKETMITENNTQILLYHVDANKKTALYEFNFWVHAILIKLVPCCILTIISLILIRVLCQAAKRRMKLKCYSPANMKPPVESNGELKPSSKRSIKTDRRTDRTTTLLVAVLLLFLITEFPQGILGLLSGILKKCFFEKCYAIFGEIMDLLALINAAIGFVLYGLMSKQFRTSFKSVFFKRRVSRIELTRVTGVTTTCV